MTVCNTLTSLPSICSGMRRASGSPVTLDRQGPLVSLERVERRGSLRSSTLRLQGLAV